MYQYCMLPAKNNSIEIPIQTPFFPQIECDAVCCVVAGVPSRYCSPKLSESVSPPITFRYPRRRRLYICLCKDAGWVKQSSSAAGNHQTSRPCRAYLATLELRPLDFLDLGATAGTAESGESDSMASPELRYTSCSRLLAASQPAFSAILPTLLRRRRTSDSVSAMVAARLAALVPAVELRPLASEAPSTAPLPKRVARAVSALLRRRYEVIKNLTKR